MNATVKNVRARGRELKAAMVCAATVWFAASAGAQVTFEDVTGTMGLGGSGSWVDIDSDGWVDLAPGWRNEHGTKFVKTGVGGGGGAWADMDNDGCMDSFAPAGGGIGFSACEDKPHGLRLPDRPHRVSDGGTLIDIDNDGLIDVWWGGYENFPTVGGYPDGIYRNLGERSFKRLHVLGPARSSRGTTACDFDQDHDMDVVVAPQCFPQGPAFALHPGREGVVGVGPVQGHRGHVIGDLNQQRVELVGAAHPTETRGWDHRSPVSSRSHPPPGRSGWGADRYCRRRWART